MESSLSHHLTELASEQKNSLREHQQLEQQAHQKLSLKIEKMLKETEKWQDDLNSVNASVKNLTSLYSEKGNGNQVDYFVSKVPTDEYFSGEEAFTKALTSYSRKQFFEGIGDLAGSKDKLRYELLEISNPESLLIKGESEDITQNECLELARLQNLYENSMRGSLEQHMSLAGLKASVAKAGEQLALLNTKRYEPKNAKKQTEAILKNVEETNGRIQHLYDGELATLLDDLQQLQGCTVLQGNYDLKIARQDYFISKQNEIITQLLLQCSRYNFLTMMNEVEMKSHRNSYYLLSTMKSLLEAEIEALTERIALMGDPVALADVKDRETIDSQDELLLSLYNTFVSLSNEDEMPVLYKTYNSLIESIQVFSKSMRSNDEKVEQSKLETDAQMEILDKELSKCYKLLTKSSSANHEQLSEGIIKLESNLSSAEKAVNDVVKDIVAKRKILETDSIKAMERTIFPNFFNDPARLKRNIKELKARVNALSHAS